MYSILFSRIREELGLCYNVGAGVGPITYPDCVAGQIYGNLSPNNVKLFIRECEKELVKIVKNGLPNRIFECAKIDAVAGLLRSTETSIGMAKKMLLPLLFDDNRNFNAIVKQLQSVTLEDCNEVARQILCRQHNWAIMLPKK